MRSKSKELHAEGTPPALDFVRMIGLPRMKDSKDAVWLVNSLNDDTLQKFVEVCSGYTPEVRMVVAQSIARGTTVDDLEQLIHHHVEAAPALAPFYNHPKHKFNNQRHCDLQVGEWSEIVYRHFTEQTPYPYQRSLIRGHALVFFVTGSSAPRIAAYRNKELLQWIGEHALELGEHFDTLEERKIWDRDFLEEILNGPSKALHSGLL